MPYVLEALKPLIRYLEKNHILTHCRERLEAEKY